MSVFRRALTGPRSARLPDFAVAARRRTAPLRLRAIRAGSWARRSVLGLLLRFDSQSASDPGALLNRFPDEALMPLRRVGLDPVPELGRQRDESPVSRLKMPFGLRGWLVIGLRGVAEVLAADPRHSATTSRT